MVVALNGRAVSNRCWEKAPPYATYSGSISDSQLPPRGLVEAAMVPVRSQLRIKNSRIENSRTAPISASTSSSVLNGPIPARRVPSGKVPIRRWAAGAQ